MKPRKIISATDLFPCAGNLAKGQILSTHHNDIVAQNVVAIQSANTQQNVLSQLNIPTPPPAQTFPSTHHSQTAASIQRSLPRRSLKIFRKYCKRLGMSLADYWTLI